MSSVKTTLRNPIVTIWEDSISRNYDAQGILGSMNLSTAARLYDFDNVAKRNSHYETLGEQIVALGKGRRLKVTDKVWAKSGNGIYIEFNREATDYWMAEDEAHPENIKYDEFGELIA
jgi:hypothetical protein